jgi:hypothetical protein
VVGTTGSASTRNRGGARTTWVGMDRSAKVAGPQRILDQKQERVKKMLPIDSDITLNGFFDRKIE